MSAWGRVPVAASVFCGGCGEPIPAGAAVYHVVIQGLRRPKWRCEACAGPAPPPLPEVVDNNGIVTALLSSPAFVPLAQARPFDWRLRAAGREPGEDDA